LAFILKHAGTGPLHLHVLWPVAKGTLKLIASAQIPIESLWLQDLGVKSINFNRFAKLNLSSLRMLKLEDLTEETEGFLDLVLLSDPKELKLSLKDDFLGLGFDFFAHKLLLGVVDLALDFSQ
jgi:hypothetical protein